MRKPGMTLEEHREVGNPSDLAEKAYEALLEIAKKEGADTASRVAALVIAPFWKKSFRGGEWIQSKRHFCPHRILGKRSCRWFCKPPGTDHQEEWRDPDGVVNYVSHPYNLGFDQIKEMVEYAAREGLEFDINGMSHYFPGHTFTVIWRKPRVRE